jgi:hypothetical protein
VTIIYVLGVDGDGVSIQCDITSAIWRLQPLLLKRHHLQS